MTIQTPNLQMSPVNNIKNKNKTFNLLLAAQSLSAFGDNAVYSVIMGILLAGVSNNTITLSEFGLQSALYINCLLLPYVVLSPLLGWLSDRFEKRSVLIWGNAIKAFGCLVGLLGLFIGKNTMFIAYLIVGVGAAIYSPSKYGIIPELKNPEDLVKGNAAIEMTTMFSILTGIVGGGLLVDNLGARLSILILFAIFIMSAFLNYLMERSSMVDKNALLAKALADFNITLKNIFTNKYILIPVLGATIFWFSANFVKLNLQTWGQDIMKLSTATNISMLAIWLSIGIILGSFIAGKVFKTGQIKQSWIFGTLMGVLIILMVVKYIDYGIIVAELIVLGAMGGIFLIPFNAAIQSRSDKAKIGKVIAIQNLFDDGSMLVSSALFWCLTKVSISSTATFLAIGGLLCLMNVLCLKPFLKKL